MSERRQEVGVFRPRRGNHAAQLHVTQCPCSAMGQRNRRPEGGNSMQGRISGERESKEWRGDGSKEDKEDKECNEEISEERREK